jgi:hypothetical protein
MSTELQNVRLRSNATPRQEANRKNAQKSTGPRTTEGKEASSQNATKHGLCANRNVIRTESQEEYNIFRDEMIADISPAGAMELMLAERIVSLSWRLKRAEHFQNAVTEALIEDGLNDSVSYWSSRSTYKAQEKAQEGNIDIVLGIVINKDFASCKTLEQLLAYEQRIESRLYRAIAELKKMQEIRRELDSKSMKDTKGNHMMDKGRETRNEEKETEEVKDEQISLNEPNQSASEDYAATGPASTENYTATCPSSLNSDAAKRSQSLLCDWKSKSE